MFQYTTTTVINQNKDFSTGLTPLFEGSAGVLKIKRHNNFKKEYVQAVYKRAATDPVLAQATLTIPGTLKAGFYRLFMYVRLSGSQNSIYANDMVFKGKPFFVEFEVKTDNESASDVAARLVSNTKKYLTMMYDGKELIKVSNSEGTVTIDGTSGYQLFTKCELQYFDPNKGNWTFGGYNGEYVPQQEATLVRQGAEGFGTYEYMLKNLRLPTAANTRWTRIAMDETPIPGAKYNQYTIYYCVNRGVMGGDAVGEVTRSRTIHVFYVNTDVASQFETALETLGTVIEVNTTSVADPANVPDTVADMQESIASVKEELD